MLSRTALRKLRRMAGHWNGGDMPKIVDHQAQRAIVSEIAAQLIAKEGLDGTKVREIARLAKCSTSIVSHYFRNKHDLLMSAYRMRMERTTTAVLEAANRGASLLECLSVVLPLDQERTESWRIWLAFWGLATTDETFMREQCQRSREAAELFHRAILDSGAMAECAQSWLAAQALLGSISGIATQAVYDPEFWPPERQVQILERQIECLTAGTHRT